MLEIRALNENQRAAVEADRQATLVLAGPGSGKTAVLICRLARIIGETPSGHFRVLGLTFTRRAAVEMQERARVLLGGDSDRAVLTTFHSFAAEALRQHGTHVGVKPDFTVLTQDADREAILEKAIRESEISRPDLDRASVGLLPLITNLLEKLVPPHEAANHIRDPELATTIAFLYGAYREALLAENSLDFATLLCFAFELFDSQPAVARQMRSTYQHVLVDEFQDTSLAQFRLLQQLVGPDGSNLFVVADDDQIIYQWNGADPKRLEELQEQYEMQTVQLPTNYRCPAPVIELANALISRNRRSKIERLPLRAAQEKDRRDDCVVVREFEDAEEEATWVASDIANLAPNERDNCVVLARSTRLLRDAQPYFANAGIEAVLAVRRSDFESAPFRWLMSMLRLANGRGDKAALAAACRSFYRLKGVDLSVDDVVASSAARGGDLLRSFVEEALARTSLEASTREFLAGPVRNLVDALEYRRFIASSIVWFGTLNTSAIPTEEKDFADFAVESEIWESLTAQMRGRFPQVDLPLSAFLQELDLSPKVPPIPPGAVRCYTIHNAKGMEFPRVYLIGLAEDVLPSFQAIKEGDESDQMQEERRNCFVGITRTSEQLVLTYARQYFGWPKRRSRFLKEMGVVAGSGETF